MKRKLSSIYSVGLIFSLLISCGPAVLPQTVTPSASPPSEGLILTAEMGLTLAAMLTSTALCNDLCSNNNASMSMTAAMATNFAATPSNTPPAWATIIPAAGDLGWGTIYGVILDGVTYLPLAGTTVKCEQSSQVSPYLCNGVTITDKDGIYIFNNVFFHDTDRITLIVEAPGYMSLHFEQALEVQPELHIDLALSPTFTDTPTPIPPPLISCTPPACANGILACGLDGGCPGGCGTICLLQSPTH